MNLNPNKIEIIDFNGKIVISELVSSSQHEKRFDVSLLKAGLYFIRVVSNTNTIFDKLVVK